MAEVTACTCTCIYCDPHAWPWIPRAQRPPSCITEWRNQPIAERRITALVDVPTRKGRQLARWVRRRLRCGECARVTYRPPRGVLACRHCGGVLSRPAEPFVRA